MPELQAESIHIEGVARRFGKRWALAGVTLEIPAGSTWMIVGHNGSGKTTLLRCLATELQVHRGTILVGQADLWARRAKLREGIGMLAHQLHVWDDLSPRDNLLMRRRLGGLQGDVDALLERVGLEPRRKDPVRAMSAGMKRRLALARLLLKRPRIALLDEPFSALDPEGRTLVMDVIRELNGAGATVVIATHMHGVAAEVCTHCAELDGGRLVSTGPSAQREPQVPV